MSNAPESSCPPPVLPSIFLESSASEDRTTEDVTVPALPTSEGDVKAEALQKLPRRELQEMCREIGLWTAGFTRAIVDRILRYLSFD